MKIKANYIYLHISRVPYYIYVLPTSMTATLQSKAHKAVYYSYTVL